MLGRVLAGRSVLATRGGKTAGEEGVSRRATADHSQDGGTTLTKLTIMNTNDNSNTVQHCDHGAESSVQRAMCRLVMLHPLVKMWEGAEENLATFVGEINQLEKDGKAVVDNGGVFVPHAEATLAFLGLIDRAEAAIGVLKTDVGGHVGLRSLVAFKGERRSTHKIRNRQAVREQWEAQDATGHGAEFELCAEFIQGMMELFEGELRDLIHQPESLPDTLKGTEWVSLDGLREAIAGLLSEDGPFLDTLQDIHRDTGINQHLEFDPTKEYLVRQHACMHLAFQGYHVEEEEGDGSGDGEDAEEA